MVVHGRFASVSSQSSLMVHKQHAAAAAETFVYLLLMICCVRDIHGHQLSGTESYNHSVEVKHNVTKTLEVMKETLQQTTSFRVRDRACVIVSFSIIITGMITGIIPVLPVASLASSRKCYFQDYLTPTWWFWPKTPEKEVIELWVISRDSGLKDCLQTTNALICRTT